MKAWVITSNPFSGTITKVDWDNMNGKPEDTPLFYYNWQQAVPAEEVLREWIRRFVELEWIPWPGLWDWEGGILQAENPQHQEQVRRHSSRFSPP